MLQNAHADIDAAIGAPDTVLADNGFANGEAVAELQDQGIEVLVATGAEARQRPYDFRPPKDTGPLKEPVQEWSIKMKAQMESEGARAKYNFANRPSSQYSASSRKSSGCAIFICVAWPASTLNGCSQPLPITASGSTG